MKRKGIFTIIVAAAATFGILFATMGPPANHQHGHHGHHQHCSPEQVEQSTE